MPIWLMLWSGKGQTKWLLKVYQGLPRIAEKINQNSRLRYSGITVQVISVWHHITFCRTSTGHPSHNGNKFSWGSRTMALIPTTNQTNLINALWRWEQQFQIMKSWQDERSWSLREGLPWMSLNSCSWWHSASVWTEPPGSKTAVLQKGPTYSTAGSVRE